MGLIGGILLMIGFFCMFSNENCNVITFVTTVFGTGLLMLEILDTESKKRKKLKRKYSSQKVENTMLRTILKEKGIAFPGDQKEETKSSETATGKQKE